MTLKKKKKNENDYHWSRFNTKITNRTKKLMQIHFIILQQKSTKNERERHRQWSGIKANVTDIIGYL